MITLVTGQPGAGKTLFSLYQVKALADKEGRPVFYSGINDLNLPWSELEKAEDWHQCPVGAIIVIDECQRAFRPRGTGSQVPEYIAKFETHRHQGLDIFLITQHPMLVDSNIRRLVGRHCHVMRAFGSKAANVHEWGEVREQVDKNRSGSMSTLWKYPKEVFSWYKSAEMHTHKLRIPPRLFFLVLAPFIMAGLVYGVYNWWKPRSSGETLRGQLGVKSAQGASGTVSAASLPVKDRGAYLDERTPRIAGLQHTAPIYDQITAPNEAPIPVGCIVSKGSCSCIDQQGADYLTDDATCRHIVKHGMFVSWRSKGSERKEGEEKKTSHRDPEQIRMDG